MPAVTCVEQSRVEKNFQRQVVIIREKERKTKKEEILEHSLTMNSGFKYHKATSHNAFVANALRHFIFCLDDCFEINHQASLPVRPCPINPS